MNVVYPSANDDAASDEKEVHRIAADALIVPADTMRELDLLIAAGVRSCHVVR